MSDERARLFVALQLPAAVRARLFGWAADVVGTVSGLRAVPAASLHVTLCFLGWRGADEIPSIARAVGAVASSPVAALSLGEPAWLPVRRPRVLAVDLADPSAALSAVQSAVSGVLQAGGWYATEARPFRAHVTVARVGKGARVPAVDLPGPPSCEFEGSRVVLLRSHLGAGGSRYESLASVALGSAAAVVDPLDVVSRFHAEQRRAYAGEGIDGLRAVLADDVVWHVPGRSAIAGEHRGIEGVLAYLEKRRSMTDSSFVVSVHGMSVIDGRVVQLAAGRAMRDGRELAWETVGVFRVADDRVAECWLIPFDQLAFDEIWS